MYVTCTDYSVYFMLCSMHGIWPISCIRICIFMRGAGIFHAWYRHIPCVVQAYSMRGTGVFHAWYRRIPCVVQVYSMCGTGIFHVWCRCVFTVHGAGISMHALAVYSTGIYQISIHVPTDFVLATILVG